MDTTVLIELLFVLRYIHILAGITWIGMLYYFNFVQTPFFATDLGGTARGPMMRGLAPNALWWFRWGAMFTFLSGWLYLLTNWGHGGYSPQAVILISTGGAIGTLMWFNVWFVIWPRQKKILGGMASGTPHPDAAKLAGTAGKASRFNTYASGPMLFAMLGAPHFSVMSGPVLLVVTLIGVGFWFGMIKRSFKIKPTV
jgi:uncharacterized membrane protein